MWGRNVLLVSRGGIDTGGLMFVMSATTGGGTDATVSAVTALVAFVVAGSGLMGGS